jgi:uncharacterized protein YceH (UPF0502 family)
MPALRAFDPFEQRVVGCLVEKELSTPDAYPLTLNALVAACNQTSNREPVSRLTPGDVEGALHRLMADLLVWRDRGARALRFKHSLDEKLGLRDPSIKAVLAELLLRGAQTPGELRARTPRMHPFGELGEVEESLRALAARGLVEELPRQPGQKERRWRHLLGSGNVAAPASRESDDAAPRAAAAARVDLEPPKVHATQAEPAVVRAPPPAAAATSGADLASRVAALERRVEELEAMVIDLLPARRD